MPPTDVAFTFDPSPIVDAIGRVNDSISGMGRGMERESGNMSRSITRGVVRATAIVGTLVGAFRGLRNILNRMPEIGEVFGLAKDIFFRNFLFPIRQALLPLLQGLLDWVRDNRALFVRWGAAVAKAVQVVVDALRFMIRLARQIGQRLLDWLGLDSLDEFVNILQFKIATVLIGIRVMASGIAGFLSDLWGQIGDESESLLSNLFGAFVEVGQDILGWLARIGEGFMSTFNIGDILETVLGLFDQLVGTFRNLWEALFGGKRGERWGEFFRGLGALAGGVLMLVVEGIAALNRVLLNLINQVIKTEFFQTLVELLSQIAEVLGGLATRGGELLAGLAGGLRQVGQPGGTPETTAGDNRPGVFGGTGFLGLGGGGGQPGGTTNQEITVQITGADLSDPEATRRAVEDGIQQSINEQRQLQGAF